MSEQWEYFYKNDKCPANSRYCHDCICWHKEGTGPIHYARHDDMVTNMSVWRKTTDKEKTMIDWDKPLKDESGNDWEYIGEHNGEYICGQRWHSFIGRFDAAGNSCSVAAKLRNVERRERYLLIRNDGTPMEHCQSYDRALDIITNRTDAVAIIHITVEDGKVTTEVLEP